MTTWLRAVGASAAPDFATPPAVRNAVRRDGDRERKEPRTIRPEYWGVFNCGLVGILLQADLTYTLVLEVGPFSASSNPLPPDRALETAFAQVFDDLHPDTTIQVLHLSEGFDSRVMSARRTLLSISVHTAPKRLWARIVRRLARLARPGTLGVTQHEHEVALDRLHEASTRVLSVLSHVGVMPRLLPARELWHLVGQQLLLPSRSPERGRSTGRVPSPGTLRCGDHLVRSLSLTVLPPRSDVRLLDTLLTGLPTAARVHVAVSLDDHPTAHLLPSDGQAHVLSSSGSPYRVPPAPSDVVPCLLQPKLRSVVTVILSVHAHQKDAQERLDEQARQVLEVLRQDGLEVIVDSSPVNLSQLLGALPGHGRRARRSVLSTAEQAAQLVAAVQNAA